MGIWDTITSKVKSVTGRDSGQELPLDSGEPGSATAQAPAQGEPSIQPTPTLENSASKAEKDALPAAITSVIMDGVEKEAEQESAETGSRFPKDLNLFHNNFLSNFYQNLFRRGFIGGVLETDDQALKDFVTASNSRNQFVKQLVRVQQQIKETEVLASNQRTLELELVPQLEANKEDISLLESKVAEQKQELAEQKKKYKDDFQGFQNLRIKSYGIERWMPLVFIILAILCVVVDLYMLKDYFQNSLGKKSDDSWPLAASIVAAAGIAKVIYDSLFEGTATVAADYAKVNRRFMRVFLGVMISMLVFFGVSRGLDVVASKHIAQQKLAIEATSGGNNDPDGDDFGSLSDGQAQTTPQVDENEKEVKPAVPKIEEHPTRFWSNSFGGGMLSFILLITTFASAVMLSKAINTDKKVKRHRRIGKMLEQQKAELDEAEQTLDTTEQQLQLLRKNNKTWAAKLAAYQKVDYVKLLHQLYKQEAELILGFVNEETKQDVSLLTYFQQLGGKFELLNGDLGLSIEMIQNETLADMKLNAIRFSEGEEDRQSPKPSQSSGGPRARYSSSDSDAARNYNYGQRPHQRIRNIITNM